jgi:DUF4097 and DUF4098 domain-containing protein YvlB
MKTWMAVLVAMAASRVPHGAPGKAAAGPQQSVEERRAAARDGLVEIENPAGSVRVLGWERAEVSVTGTLGPGAQRLVLNSEDKRTRIEVEVQGNPNNVHSDLEVRVPAGSGVSVESFAAHIRISGVSGAVRAESVNGSIAVSEGAREVQAETVNGSVEVTARARRVRAESVNGQVTVLRANGEIDASTVNGSLTVRDVTFQRGRLETMAGSIHFEGELAPKAWLEVESVSGSVELVLSPQAGASFKVSTFTGAIRNELSGAQPQKADHAPMKELAFTNGNGSARVTVNTLSGTVALRRR